MGPGRSGPQPQVPIEVGGNEDRLAIASEARANAVARINLAHAGGVGEVDLNGMSAIERFSRRHP